MIGSVESRQKFLACPQKSNIPALGSNSAEFRAAAPRKHTHIFGGRDSPDRGLFTPFVPVSIPPLLSLSFFPPSLLVNRGRGRRYVVFVRFAVSARLIRYHRWNKTKWWKVFDIASKGRKGKKEQEETNGRADVGYNRERGKVLITSSRVEPMTSGDARWMRGNCEEDLCPLPLIRREIARTICPISLSFGRLQF